MRKWISKKLNNKKGFTLVEILVVILIIGILFVAFLPKIDFAGDKARETGVKADLRTYMVASEQLLKENAGLKDTVQAGNVTELNKSLDANSKFTGKISALKDPWKQAYEVEFSNVSGTERRIMFKSYGKSGVANKPDFVILTQYIGGSVLSCTAGLNTNIGADLSNAEKDHTAIVGPPAIGAVPKVDLTAVDGYKALTCFAGLQKGAINAPAYY